jgi:hypothetical protein
MKKIILSLLIWTLLLIPSVFAGTVTIDDTGLDVDGTVSGTDFVGDGSGLSSISESDPTVPTNLKNGVSWTEVSDRPSGLDVQLMLKME